MWTATAADTHQVEDTVRVASELGNLREGRVLPHEDLVLRVAMCAHLKEGLGVRASEGLRIPRGPIHGVTESAMGKPEALVQE